MISLINKRGQSNDSLVFIVVIGVFIIAVAGTISTYYLIEGLRDTITTGYATQAGQMNITIESSADINLTYRTINFSSGRVDSGQQNATVATNGTVARGNWTAQYNGFVLQNIGNVNVSVEMLNQYTNVTLLAGTNPYYGFNVTHNKTTSCLNDTSYPMASWYAFNGTTTSGNGVKICEKLYFEDTRDEIRIDLWLNIPYDSRTGTLGDVFTFTGTSNP